MKILAHPRRDLQQSLTRGMAPPRCFALAANASGTAVGLFDPLGAVAEICQEHDIWLHVDAAHGGGALVSRKWRHLVAGIERADSVVWDAHKMLCTPTLCAAVLVRKHQHLDGAFSQEASYLAHDEGQPGFNFMSRTVECTKAGLGLKLFMTLPGTIPRQQELMTTDFILRARCFDRGDLIVQYTMISDLGRRLEIQRALPALRRLEAGHIPHIASWARAIRLEARP